MNTPPRAAVTPQTYLVASIAAAHGWDVKVRERDDGGTRIEVTGVEMPQTRLMQTS
ncbi:hypothetical protein [Halosegnis rubeus]|jgi:hypothetical protein|uniref:hypothetical protein n=1 Tax=Halosegnis rubeus TaxID=2212850 RepID=UPI001561D294|nr:hypothetical protein [Halosegnis rubeus]